MKYGEVLDFRTQNKAVVGKKYIFSDELWVLVNNPKILQKLSLMDVLSENSMPFVSSTGYRYQFIREIIEEEPKYRPYKNTDEMIEDFKQRAKIATREMSLPLIWVKSKDSDFRYLLSDFGTVAVDAINFIELLDDYTYLDGSPCGIKEE